MSPFPTHPVPRPSDEWIDPQLVVAAGHQVTALQPSPPGRFHPLKLVFHPYEIDPQLSNAPGLNPDGYGI